MESETTAIELVVTDVESIDGGNDGGEICE
ncbi:MAG: hypothetical protein ACI9LI_000649 [Saprospiraceae bacterium]